MTAENNDARFLGIETEDPPLPFNIVAKVTLASDAPAARLTELHRYAERCPMTALIRGAQQLTVETD